LGRNIWETENLIEDGRQFFYLFVLKLNNNDALFASVRPNEIYLNDYFGCGK
jgi:hypothetical protein